MVTKILREPVGIERTREYPKLPTVLESPELSRALAIGQLRTVNHVPVQDRACGIHEEEAASGAKRVVDAAPEPVGMALGNVRKPERKEDDVIVLIWLPAEEIVNPELELLLPASCSFARASSRISGAASTPTTLVATSARRIVHSPVP